MRFSLDEDQLALRDAVRAFCADRLDLADVAGREGKPADSAVWLGLADLGVLELLVEEPGSEIGLVEASIAFEQLGAHLVTGPLLWSALAAPFVAGVAGGGVRVAGVELDEPPDAPEPPAVPVVVEHGDECDTILVLRPDRVELCSRSALPPTLAGSPLDPLTPTAVFPSIPAGEQVGGADAARRMRHAGTVLSAALLVGVAQGALDTARGYALERAQFGVPIGSFQAVKHLLADMYVRVELARAATYAAAAGPTELAATGPAAGGAARAASAAKLLAGEAGVANGRAAVQILGGMGFTWDMLPHYFLKRAWVLENGFGSASAHAARLASSVAVEVEVEVEVGRS